MKPPRPLKREEARRHVVVVEPGFRYAGPLGFLDTVIRYLFREELQEGESMEGTVVR